MGAVLLGKRSVFLFIWCWYLHSKTGDLTVCCCSDAVHLGQLPAPGLWLDNDREAAVITQLALFSPLSIYLVSTSALQHTRLAQNAAPPFSYELWGTGDYKGLIANYQVNSSYSFRAHSYLSVFVRYIFPVHCIALCITL